MDSRTVKPRKVVSGISTTTLPPPHAHVRRLALPSTLSSSSSPSPSISPHAHGYSSARTTTKSLGPQIQAKVDMHVLSMNPQSISGRGGGHANTHSNSNSSNNHLVYHAQSSVGQSSGSGSSGSSSSKSTTTATTATTATASSSHKEDLVGMGQSRQQQLWTMSGSGRKTPTLTPVGYANTNTCRVNKQSGHVHGHVQDTQPLHLQRPRLGLPQSTSINVNTNATSSTMKRIRTAPPTLATKSHCASVIMSHPVASTSQSTSSTKLMVSSPKVSLSNYEHEQQYRGGSNVNVSVNKVTNPTTLSTAHEQEMATLSTTAARTMGGARSPKLLPIRDESFLDKTSFSTTSPILSTLSSHQNSSSHTSNLIITTNSTTSTTTPVTTTKTPLSPKQGPNQQTGILERLTVTVVDENQSWSLLKNETQIQSHHEVDRVGVDEVELREREIEAKVNRKILDLEISNASLLVVNAALERSKLKQATEIRELRRRLLEGKLCPTTTTKTTTSSRIIDSYYKKDYGNDHGIDDDVDDDDDDGNDDEFDDQVDLENLCRDDLHFAHIVRGLTTLIKNSQEALMYQTPSNQKSIIHKAKVLNCVQVEEQEQEQEQEFELEGEEKVEEQQKVENENEEKEWNSQGTDLSSETILSPLQPSSLSYLSSSSSSSSSSSLSPSSLPSSSVSQKV